MEGDGVVWFSIQGDADGKAADCVDVIVAVRPVLGLGQSTPLTRKP